MYIVYTIFLFNLFNKAGCLVLTIAKIALTCIRVAGCEIIALSIVDKVNYKKMMHFPPKVLIWHCLSHIWYLLFAFYNETNQIQSLYKLMV